LIRFYYCASCDRDFSAVVCNMSQKIKCPFCGSSRRNDLPIRKRVYFLNYATGFLTFKNGDELNEYRKEKHIERQKKGAKKRKNAKAKLY